MAMAKVSIDRETRLRFLKIDDATRTSLRATWPLIETHLDGILRAFYQHLSTFEAIAPLIQGPNQVEKLMNAQRRHWQRLFAAEFDDAFSDAVIRIGYVHQKIGLEPRWYLGAYSIFLERLESILDNAFKRNRERRREIISAVTKVVFLDMDLAVSVYQMVEIEARERRATEGDGLIKSFDSEVHQELVLVDRSLEQVETMTRSVSQTSEETMSRSVTVATAAEQATSNVQTVAAATEELAATIQEITVQVSNSNSLATEAMDKAGRADAAIGSLKEAADKIGGVVKLINDIARQVNLLALNATIEAARAGDAGKGFAVVASEVKNLAIQTSRATDEVAAQIDSMQRATSTTAAEIATIVSSIRQMTEVSSAIAAAMEEQSATTQEISRNIHEAVIGTRDVSSNISIVSTNARSASDAVAGTMTAIADLGSRSRKLKADIGRFFEQVRAAQ